MSALGFLGLGLPVAIGASVVMFFALQVVSAVLYDRDDTARAATEPGTSEDVPLATDRSHAGPGVDAGTDGGLINLTPTKSTPNTESDAR